MTSQGACRSDVARLQESRGSSGFSLCRWKCRVSKAQERTGLRCPHQALIEKSAVSSIAIADDD